jgi:hypothetical protein
MTHSTVPPAPRSNQPYRWWRRGSRLPGSEGSNRRPCRLWPRQSGSWPVGWGAWACRPTSHPPAPCRGPPLRPAHLHRPGTGGLVHPNRPLPLVRACSHLRPGELTSPAAGTKFALRSLAGRYESLQAGIKALGAQLEPVTMAAAPELVKVFGVGTEPAGALPVAAGDNPDRLRSEAAFSMLCGSSPVEASSGKVVRHRRLNRGGDRQANAALYRVVLVRLRWHEATRNYMARRTTEGKVQERDHPLPSTLRRT